MGDKESLVKTLSEASSSPSGWSLHSDVQLLGWLEGFSESLKKRVDDVAGRVQRLVEHTNKAEQELQNTFNSFRCLSSTQFIENRVQEDDETVSIDTEARHEQGVPSQSYENDILPRYKEALSNAWMVYEEQIGKLEKQNVQLGPKKAMIRERPRPLPHIIGSEEFLQDDSCGLLEDRYLQMETFSSDSDIERDGAAMEETNRDVGLSPKPDSSENESDVSEEQVGSLEPVVSAVLDFKAMLEAALRSPYIPYNDGIIANYSSVAINPGEMGENSIRSETEGNPHRDVLDEEQSTLDEHSEAAQMHTDKNEVLEETDARIEDTNKNGGLLFSSNLIEQSAHSPSNSKSEDTRSTNSSKPSIRVNVIPQKGKHSGTPSSALPISPFVGGLFDDDDDDDDDEDGSLLFGSSRKIVLNGDGRAKPTIPREFFKETVPPEGESAEKASSKNNKVNLSSRQSDIFKDETEEQNKVLSVATSRKLPLSPEKSTSDHRERADKLLMFQLQGSINSGLALKESLSMLHRGLFDDDDNAFDESDDLFRVDITSPHGKMTALQATDLAEDPSKLFTESLESEDDDAMESRQVSSESGLQWVDLKEDQAEKEMGLNMDGGIEKYNSSLVYSESIDAIQNSSDYGISRDTERDSIHVKALEDDLDRNPSSLNLLRTAKDSDSWSTTSSLGDNNNNQDDTLYHGNIPLDPIQNQDDTLYHGNIPLDPIQDPRNRIDTHGSQNVIPNEHEDKKHGLISDHSEENLPSLETGPPILENTEAACNSNAEGFLENSQLASSRSSSHVASLREHMHLDPKMLLPRHTPVSTRFLPKEYPESPIPPRGDAVEDERKREDQENAHLVHVTMSRPLGSSKRRSSSVRRDPVLASLADSDNPIKSLSNETSSRQDSTNLKFADSGNNSIPSVPMIEHVVEERIGSLDEASREISFGSQSMIQIESGRGTSTQVVSTDIGMPTILEEHANAINTPNNDLGEKNSVQNKNHSNHSLLFGDEGKLEDSGNNSIPSVPMIEHIVEEKNANLNEASRETSIGSQPVVQIESVLVPSTQIVSTDIGMPSILEKEHANAINTPENNSGQKNSSESKNQSIHSLFGDEEKLEYSGNNSIPSVPTIEHILEENIANLDEASGEISIGSQSIIQIESGRVTTTKTVSTDISMPTTAEKEHASAINTPESDLGENNSSQNKNQSIRSLLFGDEDEEEISLFGPLKSGFSASRPSFMNATTKDRDLFEDDSDNKHKGKPASSENTISDGKGSEVSTTKVGLSGPLKNYRRLLFDDED